MNYLKFRLGVVILIAVFTAIGVMGLIKLINTASLGAVPLYIHVLIGALVLPLVAFLLEYRGMDQNRALGVGFLSSVLSVFFVVLVSEGFARMINGAVSIGVSTFIYALAVGVIAGTVMVMLAEKLAVKEFDGAVKQGAARDR